MYDYLVVGSGISGALFAYLAKQKGKKVLVIEKRNHLGGNIYLDNVENIKIHRYGPHIFHTNDKNIWEFVKKFSIPNNFILNTLAFYKGQFYNLPFNMNTFYQMFNVLSPDSAISCLELLKKDIDNPKNLEEQALSQVGEKIYNTLIKGYTEKQWGRKCKELSPSIIKRIPIRYTFNNNYFNDTYQGIFNYNEFINKLLEGIEIKYVDFIKERNELENIADKIVYTGSIDEYYNYKLGILEYRNVYWETIKINKSNHQGTAIINYTDIDVPFTRCIEHKHFEYFNEDVYKLPYTYISKEYSSEWDKTKERFYPICDDKNNKLYNEYKNIKNDKVIFLGRLGEYKYYDMDDIISRIFLFNDTYNI